ncbi:unnamed protein product [Closterium sp. NIES-54]
MCVQAVSRASATPKWNLDYYTGGGGAGSGGSERREPAPRPASPVCTVRHASRVRPPPDPGTYSTTLRPSSVPRHVAQPSSPASPLPDVPDRESDLARAASSSAASALVTELVCFAATYRLDSSASLVSKSESDCPPSVGGELALGSDVLEDRQFDFECRAAAVPHLASMLLCPGGDPDALDISTPRSYAEAITSQCFSQW